MATAETIAKTLGGRKAGAGWMARCLPERTVHIRVGGLKGRLYLDLCDATWRAMEIDATGWRVADNPPVRFRSAAGMQPLPIPVRGAFSAIVRALLDPNTAPLRALPREDRDFFIAALAFDNVSVLLAAPDLRTVADDADCAGGGSIPIVGASRAR